MNFARMSLAAVALIGLMSAAPGFGQSASTNTSAGAPAKKAPDPNEVVCEKEEVIGSRLQTQRVCHTRAEWAELRHQDRQEIEKVQIQRGCSDTC